MPSPQKATIHFGETPFHYIVRQNRRIKRKYRLILSQDEGLVYETYHQPDVQKSLIDVARHKTWIINTLSKQKRLLKRRPQLKQKTQSVFVAGVEKELHIALSQPRVFFKEDAQRLTLGFTEFQIEKTEWMKKLEFHLIHRAQNTLPLRLKYLAREFGFSYTSVKVKNMKTQWGSCSKDKRIHLNWRLVLAPRDVCDYVLLHELAHTKQMNHSDKFWHIVEKFSPHFKRHKAWLKAYGRELKVG